MSLKQFEHSRRIISDLALILPRSGPDLGLSGILSILIR
jgi:hypothetical protein